MANEVPLAPVALASTGKVTDKIPVKISYRILELFSGGLYSSPNKAIEELVANSYDAYAQHVQVILSQLLDEEDSYIAVIDDGESMDLDGLKDLWMIAKSKKRDAKLGRRPPIGKFGIGKLATWVLADSLTHVCRRGKKYLSVTMNYGGIKPEATTDSTSLDLDVRELSATDAEKALSFLPLNGSDGGEQPQLFGKSASKSWTVAILTDLKAMAKELKIGRLRWVLSTALPLMPDFSTFLNGDRIVPSKEKPGPIHRWVIGRDDKVAERLGYATGRENGAANEDDGYWVELPGLGKSTGIIEVFADTLTRGKSQLIGRSHGIFVMVRERLVNVDDALFGLHALSHQTFNRFRMVIHCDGLDEYLRSSRESIQEVAAVEPLRDYIPKQFYAVEKWYKDFLGTVEHELKLTARLEAVPGDLLSRPLYNLVSRSLKNGKDSPRLTRIPSGLDPEEREKFLKNIRDLLESGATIFEDVEFTELASEDGIAIFDAEEGVVKINQAHPFYANFADSFKDLEPFKLLGIAEIATEAYMGDEGISPSVIKSLLEQRDRFLRALVYAKRISAKLVAEHLREAGSHKTGLEQACHAAFSCLGFDVRPLGGQKKGADGLARATLGVRAEGEESKSYTIAYDAKSTVHEKVQTSNIKMAQIVEHRKKHGADYSVVVGKDFQTSGDDATAVIRQAKAQKVTILRTGDLARLVEIAALRRLGLDRLEELFTGSFSPAETEKWVDSIMAEPPTPTPIPEIVKAAHDLQSTLSDPVDVSSIHMHLLPDQEKFGISHRSDVREWLEAVSRLVPEYLSIHGERVFLNTSPDILLGELTSIVREMPESDHKELMLKRLESTQSKG